MGQNFWEGFWDSLADTLFGWLNYPKEKELEELELEQERLRLKQEKWEYQQKLIAEQSKIKTIALLGAIGLGAVALITLSKR